MRGAAKFQSLFTDDVTNVIAQDAVRKGRSPELIDLRNQLFIDRFAYYSIYTDKRYEAILEALERELFLAQFTLGKLVAQYFVEIKTLKQSKPPLQYFRNKWDHIKW